MNRLRQRIRQLFFYRLVRFIQLELGILLPGCADHQQPQVWPGNFRFERLQYFERVRNASSAPASSWFRYLKIAPGRRPPAFDANAGFPHAQELSCLVFGENTCDVIVHHDDFVDLSKPLFGEHSDGCRAAAHPHAFFALSIYHRWSAR